MDSNNERPLGGMDNMVAAMNHAAVVYNQNSNVNNLTGVGNFVHNDNSTTTTVLVLNIHSNIPGTVSSSEQARAILAQIGNGLGNRTSESLSNSHIITTGEARRAPIGRPLNERINSVDYVRSIALPWMHKLKPVWGSITEAVSQISDRTRTASSAPTITAVAGLSLLAAQDRGIPLALTAGTFALFAIGNPYGFFRSPNVPHSIIVVDFFDREVLVPLSEATSSMVLHRTLARHFTGKTVLVLLQKRRYELQATQETPGSNVRTGQALPRGWTNLLQPGSKLHMNALISGPSEDIGSEFVCPACSSPFSVGIDEAMDHSDWFECPRCPSKIQVSSLRDELSVEEHHETDLAAEESSEDDINDHVTEHNRLRKTTNQDGEDPRASIENALRQCRRIRVIGSFTSTAPEWKTLSPARSWSPPEWKTASPHDWNSFRTTSSSPDWSSRRTTPSPVESPTSPIGEPQIGARLRQRWEAVTVEPHEGWSKRPIRLSASANDYGGFAILQRCIRRFASKVPGIEPNYAYVTRAVWRPLRS